MRARKGYSIRFSEDRLISILDKNLTEGVFCIESDNLQYVNHTFAFLLGYDLADELLERPFASLLANVTDINKIKNKLNQETSIHKQLVGFLKKDNTVFTGSVNLERITDVDGTYFVGSVTDITEDLQVDAKLQESNENLKKINAQLDRFLYSASHDIRQPLTSMMGLIRLMRMESFKDNNDLYLTKLETSVKKLDEFLFQVMKFSRNSHERVKSERIIVEDLIKSVYEEITNEPQKVKVMFTVEVSNSVIFYSDPHRLRLIFEQILKNSIQYADLTKSRSFLKVMIDFTPDHVNIDFVDNGIGIGRGHLDKVCEMFYRGTERSKGSGLGLYIVTETLLRLNGKITIDSEANFGTIIRLEVPNDHKGQLINRKVFLSNINRIG